MSDVAWHECGAWGKWCRSGIGTSTFYVVIPRTYVSAIILYFHAPCIVFFRRNITLHFSRDHLGAVDAMAV